MAVRSRCVSVKESVLSFGVSVEGDLLCRGDVINVVAKSNKQIKEKLRSSIKHLELHRAASLEGAPGSNDQGKIVCS